MDATEKLTVAQVESFSCTTGLYREQARALGVEPETGQRVNISLFLGLRDADEMFAAALAADLRRVLPALVEEKARAAYDRVYPGALMQEEK